MVSSVCNSLASYRQAAKSAIEAKGMIPLLSENLEGQAQSSHNACLDLVESADVVIVIIGEKQGYVTPAGLTVVEEEIGHAKKLNKRMLYFQVEATQREPGAQRADEFLSHYVNGLFRKTVESPDQLSDYLSESLSKLSSPSNSMHIPELLKRLPEVPYSWQLFMDAKPERDELAVDPLQLLNPEFSKQFKTILHADPELFSYDYGVNVSSKANRIELTQHDQNRGSTLYSSFSLESSGLTTLSTKMIGHQKSEHSFPEFTSDQFEFYASKLLKTLAHVWQSIDIHERYDRFYVEAGLQIGTLGVIGEKQIHGGTAFGNGDDLVRAFETPRLISRSNLLELSEAQRISTILFHKVTESDY